MKKRGFYTEWAYVLGLAILALGTALMQKADYGMSMVVAPAYLVHLKISQVFPGFTFGMAEYTLQAVLLALLAVVMRRFKWSYLFSFATAVLYGFMLDGAIWLVAPVHCEGWLLRGAFFLLGMVACSLGVSLLFHTYLPPEAYELFVKEVSGKIGMDVHRFKTIYDCCSCALGIALSFAFFGFGHFEGVKAGTILCALVNGWIIGRCSHLLESTFEFRDQLLRAGRARSQSLPR